MDSHTAHVASRALRYIVCQGMEQSAAVARALADYADLPGAVDLRAVESCIAATLEVPGK